MTKTGEVREYFENMGPQTRSACAEALGITKRSARLCVQELKAGGWLERFGAVKPALYRFRRLTDSEHGHGAELQEKIWRAVKLSRSFKIFDIALLSGATLDYSKRYIAFLARFGLVKKIGKDGQRAIYLTIANPPRVAPRMKSNKTKKEVERLSLMESGWVMMRALREGDLTGAYQAHEMLGKKLQLVLGKS